MQLISNNAEYMELEHSVRANKLDLEWYERLFVLQKRDRQYLRAELELYFEQIILVKKHREDNTSDEQIKNIDKNIAAPAALDGRQNFTNESYEKKADDRANGKSACLQCLLVQKHLLTSTKVLSYWYKSTHGTDT